MTKPLALSWNSVQKLLPPGVDDPYISMLAKSDGRRDVINMDFYKEDIFLFRATCSLYQSPAFLQFGAFGIVQKKIANWGLEIPFDRVQFNENAIVPRKTLTATINGDLFSRTLKRAAFVDLNKTLKEISSEWKLADEMARELSKPIPPNTYSRRHGEFCAAIIGATADLYAPELSSLYLEKIGAPSLLKFEDIAQKSFTPAGP